MVTAAVYVILLITTVTYSLNFQPFKNISDSIVGANVELDNFQTCPEYPDTPVRFKDVVISKEGQHKFIINGQIDFQETLDRPLRLVITMHRCSSKDDSGSCEYYFTFKKDRICDMMENEMMWAYFVNGTNLPATCPYKTGSYSIKGATIDMRDLKWLPLFDSYWKISSRTYMKDKLMLCLKSSLIVKRRRFIVDDGDYSALANLLRNAH